MIWAELAPTWRIVSNGQVREMDLPLIAILGDLAESGKLTHAARVAGLSHRHARNLIIGWGDFLGSPLVVMQRGRGTSLTLPGERVLWAGRRIESRLAPELDGLAGDFARGINQALGTTVPSLVVHASHDFAVALLRERLQAEGTAGGAPARRIAAPRPRLSAYRPPCARPPRPVARRRGPPSD